MLDNVLVGDTRQFTWIDSGTTPSTILHMIYDGNETLVSSQSMTNSGNGHYYALAKVNTPGYYVSEWLAMISGNPYKRREKFKAVLIEVD
jgi:hypothetical protein